MDKQFWMINRWIRFHLIVFFCIGLCTLLGCNTDNRSTADDEIPRTSESQLNKAEVEASHTLCRLFWQDGDAGTICAADLCSTENGFVAKELSVAGLKQLDVEQNAFAQMQIVGKSLIVSVRDNSDGNEGSGWLVIDTGVEEEYHGDHSHWHYNRSPKLQSETIDANHGNPAHVYRYGQRVYVAQDKSNGFSMIEFNNGLTSDKFFEGGGGHITIAALKGQIAYASWIDRTGDNAGRIDVVDLKGNGLKPKYSFKLPSGGIHGATACGNRVFFAPSDGVYWVDCDYDFEKSNDTVKLNHLSLGDKENPGYRTGSFESFANHVLCIANCKGSAPALCVIDGTTPSPKVSRYICEDIEPGQRLSTLRAVTVNGKPYAIAFAESKDLQDKLLVFDLDQNGDRKFDDLKLIKSIDIGNSKVEGHSGHHGIDFIHERNDAVITNPGDGTLQILDMNEWKISKTLPVNGQPTRILTLGGIQ
ncbi:MAG: hypothetical protein GY880_18155 [Planctomycetaceae bacterium]|nr:hypothetical protein [Planctomycetaceae bacterium]